MYCEIKWKKIHKGKVVLMFHKKGTIVDNSFRKHFKTVNVILLLFIIDIILFSIIHFVDLKSERFYLAIAFVQF